MLSKVYESHNKWINTVKKMGCTEQEAEDITSDMYLIIGKMLNKGLDISYGDEVNYYYIYRTLRTSFLQLKNRLTKEAKVPLELTLDIESMQYVDFERVNDEVLDELNKMHWYDRKVYELIQGGYSVTDLSKKTNIRYHSLYNTYRKTKDKLKVKITE